MKRIKIVSVHELTYGVLRKRRSEGLSTFYLWHSFLVFACKVVATFWWVLVIYCWANAYDIGNDGESGILELQIVGGHTFQYD